MSKETKTTTAKKSVKKEYNVHEALVLIQTTLNAPKNRYNKFGGFNYRSAEDILNAVKPLLAETNCTLRQTDNVEIVGDRYYIVVTTTLTDSKGESEVVQARAREEEHKKGMDSAMVTGATSSYARKYALNGLFAIDDSKDPDSDEFQKQVRGGTPKQVTPKPAPKPADNKVVEKKPLYKSDPKYGEIIEGIKSGKFNVDQILKTRTMTKTIEAELRSYEDVISK